MKFLIYMLPIMALALAEDASERQLVNGNNLFSAKMFSEVAKLQQGKSVVMSGFSAMSPLAQLGLASIGDSHDEILKAIGMPDDETVKSAFTTVNTNLRSVKGVTLKVANRVYIPEDAALNETFAKLSRDAFGSDVKNVDFSQNVKAAAAINSWVEDNTNKRIKDLVSPDSLDSSTRAVLVNAIYFKGSWENKFDARNTQDRDFHVSKDKTIKVPTMFKNGNFKYGESAELGAKLLELFYEGGESSFLIVLPNEVDGITALEEKLKNPENLEKAVSQMYETEVDAYIPKFKIETTIDLKEVLQKIGVTKLFGSSANLRYLLNKESDLYVSAAIQKAFIEVNEEGAEAAAASDYYTKIVGGFINKSPTFWANKPFYFELTFLNRAVAFNGVLKQPI